MSRSGLLLVLLLLAGVARAEWPRVMALHVEGNIVTREAVIRRELALAEGDRADPALIAASRQALLDLGLFRDVQVESPAVEGGVDLRVRVREKYFMLPIPRLDTSSDRDLSYGAQLRWSNVGGRNHTLNLYAERGDFPEDRLREAERSVRIAYDAPFVLDTPLRLQLGAERIERRPR